MLLRWLLWLILALVAVRGAASLLWPVAAPTGGTAAPAPAAANDARADAVRSFAVLFSEEYLTWHVADPADHAARLRPYLRTGLDEQAGWSPGSGARDQAVLDARVYADHSPQPGRRLVTVAARTSLTPAKGTGPAVQRVVYLQVPVSVSDRGLSVYDYPTFVPGPARADPQGPLYGQEVTEPPPEIRPLAEGFLRAYTGGSEAEMAYFMSPGARLTGLHGALQWQSLADLKVYRSGEGMVAVAEGVLQDPASGATVHQRWRLQVEKSDRWYVKDLL